MAARKKAEKDKVSVTVPIRITPQMHRDIDAVAEATGRSISDIARECFQQRIDAWRQSNTEPDT